MAADFEIVPLTDAIGAELRGLDLKDDMDPKLVDRMYAAWLDNIVLLVRGQALDQADLLRFSSHFGKVGDLARPKDYRPSGYDSLLPGIMLISNIREDGEPIGALPDGEMMFHHDMLHAANPHRATILYSVEVPPTGGNTLFANLYKAYETLDPAVRDRLEGRMAFNHYNYGSTQKGDDRGTPAFAESEHPVFRVHEETGRKAVYVNRLMTERVVGLDAGEGAELLAKVFDHSEKPEFVYEHVWRPGDVLMWDNRCSMHARTDFSSGHRRLLWRTTVV